MTEDVIYSKEGVLLALKQLEEAYARRDLLQLQKTEAIPAEVKRILEDIEAEFIDRIQANANLIADLEVEVKKAALSFGETVSGENIQVIHKKGSVTWDGAKLDGMMSLIPQLKDARKEGKPSAYIKTRGGA